MVKDNEVFSEKKLPRKIARLHKDTRGVTMNTG